MLKAKLKQEFLERIEKVSSDFSIVRTLKILDPHKIYRVQNRPLNCYFSMIDLKIISEIK